MSDPTEVKEEQDFSIIPTEDLGQGFEEMEGQDFSAPFLVICQATSPYLNPQNPLYIPDAKQGSIIHTQNQQIYQTVNVVPCKYTFRNVEWRPRGQGGGFVASYPRNHLLNDLVSDPLTGRIRRSNGNEIMPTAYYLCLLVEEGFDKVIIPMYSTQLKKSRRWNALMVAMRVNNQPIPMYSYSYEMSVTSESNNKGTWYGWKIEVGKEIYTNPSLYDLAKKTYQIRNFLPEKLLEAQSIEAHAGDEGVI